MPKILTAIDLFSGAGGFSLAAYNVGIDVLATVEFDQNAAQTYQKNLVERLGNMRSSRVARFNILKSSIAVSDVAGLSLFYH